jgi:hypothetical protein
MHILPSMSAASCLALSSFCSRSNAATKILEILPKIVHGMMGEVPSPDGVDVLAGTVFNVDEVVNNMLVEGGFINFTPVLCGYCQ